ncbi:TPA: colicin release lysis protein [Escherichia coli]|nr:colicin release lysis protein [Escherichia coli]
MFHCSPNPNYIRDVQGGTVAPSSSSAATGIEIR